MSTPEIVDSVNVLILVDRKVPIRNMPEKMGISMGTAHKIVHGDLAFSKLSCH